MLGLKLIHVSKRGIWNPTSRLLQYHGGRCPGVNTPDISIHFADIAGFLVSHVCYYRFGLSSIILWLLNTFFYKNMHLGFTVCAPENPHGQLCRVWRGVLELPSWGSYDPMSAIPTVGSWTMHPDGGRAISLWLLPVMRAASTRFSFNEGTLLHSDSMITFQ